MNAKHLAGIWVTVATLCACGEEGLGDGIRRPPTTIPQRPALLDVVISEVYVGAAEPGAFVELLNMGGSDVDLDGFRLKAGSDELDLPGVTLDAAGGADDRFVISGFASIVSRTSGEVALVDADSAVHAYVAWGADPGTVNSSLYADAFASGAPLSAPPQLSVPFPIPDTDALVFGDSRGCAAPSPGLPSDAPADCGAGVGALVITEFFPSTDSTVGWVEVLNTSSAALDLRGVRLCKPPLCGAIVEASEILPSGEYAIVALGVPLSTFETLAGESVGLADGITLGCTNGQICAATTLESLNAPVEVGVLRPGGSGAEAQALLNYARFGVEAGRVLSDDAIAAGLWAEGTVDAVLTAQQTWQRIESEPPGPGAWQVGSATPGTSSVP